MNDAYLEDMQFEAGRATEAQNCFAEAQIRVSELRHECEVVGEGPISVRVSYPYYCRSTDAFVGMVPVRIYRFATAEAARAFIEERSYDGDEDQYEVSGIEAPAAVPAVSDEVPF